MAILRPFRVGSKRLAFAIAIGLGLAFAAPLPGTTQELPKEPVVKELAPGVFLYINRNGLWNSGFIIGRDGVAVVDAMLTPAEARLVLAEIRKRTDRPIQYVVITHQHSDHYFGAQVYVPSAALIAHPAVREHYSRNLAREMKFRKSLSPDFDLSEVKVVLPTMLVQGEGKVLTLNLGDRDVDIYHFGPGQTPDALFVHLPAEKILFVGDVFNRKSINFMANATSFDGWFRILDRLEAMDAAVYAGGHGLPATKADIKDYRRMMTDFIDGVKDAVRRGLTEDQAAAALTLTQYSDWRNYKNFTKRNVVGLHERFAKEAKK